MNVVSTLVYPSHTHINGCIGVHLEFSVFPMDTCKLVQLGVHYFMVPIFIRSVGLTQS